jgi:hypothetical protein
MGLAASLPLVPNLAIAHSDYDRVPPVVYALHARCYECPKTPNSVPCRSLHYVLSVYSSAVAPALAPTNPFSECTHAKLPV